MAISNTLRARLEVLGGKELIELFDKIGDSAKKGFDKVDREAEQATKEVKKLERELKALDRIARNIRAKIKIDKGKTPTPHQAAALDLANDLDRRTSAIRRQIDALDDVAALTRGDGVRILGSQGDNDLLTIRDTTRGLDDLITNGRRDGLFGDIIPGEDLDRILAASERIRSENDRFFDDMESRIAAADQAEKDREKARADRDANPRPNPRANSTADDDVDRAAARREAEEEREKASLDRLRDEEERRKTAAANDAKRDQDYRDHIARERARLDSELRRHRDNFDAELGRQRAAMAREVSAARSQISTEQANHRTELGRERSRHTADLAAERSRHSADMARLQRDHIDELGRLRTAHAADLARNRAGFLRTLAAERTRFRAQLGRERATFSTDLANERATHAAAMGRERATFHSTLASERAAAARTLAAERSANLTRLSAERRAHATNLASERAAFTRTLAAERAAFSRTIAADRARITTLTNDVNALRRAMAGLTRTGRGFAGAAPGLGRSAAGIGRAFSTAARDVGRFGTALTQLEYAVSNTALRAGVGALLGVIGAGLAALGGAAALAGISAIAVLASFNAQKLQNAADAVGQSLEVFTAMKYAAGSQGVGFDEYVEGMQTLRAAMVGIMKEDENFAGAAELFKKLQIPLRSADGKDLASQYHVLRRMAQIVKALPNDNVRIEFLTNLGGGSAALVKLLPMLKEGAEALDESGMRAIKLGVVLTKEQVAEIEPLKAQIYDMWQILIGLSYKLAREIMPSLLPVLKAINAWMLDNADVINSKLVGAFDYLIQVTKDFWALWNQGSSADVTIKWTATFWYACEQIIKGFKRVWNVVATGYEFAKPALTQLSDYLGMSGPLEVALTFLAGQLLGISKLFFSVANVGLAAVRIVTNALRTMLLPIARMVLGTVAGIIGWPVLLAAGIGGVILYWDEVERIFTSAWNAFKQTFPTTAAFLEDTFGDALAKVKSFTGDTLAEFQKKFPGIVKLFEDTRASLDTLWDSIKSFNWGLVFDGISDLGMYLLRNLVDSLETLAPILDYFVQNTLQSLATILNSISWFLTSSKETLQENGDMSGELKMSREEYDAYKAKVGTTALDRNMGGHPIFGGAERIKALTERASPQSPVSAATQLPLDAAPAAMTPVNVNLSNGDTIIMMTPEENVAERLSSYSRTQAAASPGWNR